ncbi:hypothetical protein KC323_g325 [Hortaea werneckii]|nr:hypothetical protein KC323_g325 [Hortaea werneckii]
MPKLLRPIAGDKPSDPSTYVKASYNTVLLLRICAHALWSWTQSFGYYLSERIFVDRTFPQLCFISPRDEGQFGDVCSESAEFCIIVVRNELPWPQQTSGEYAHPVRLFSKTSGKALLLRSAALYHNLPNRDKLIMQFFVFIKRGTFQLVDALTTQPMWDANHLLWLDRGKLEVDNANNVPFFINKYVTLVKIRSHQAFQGWSLAGGVVASPGRQANLARKNQRRHT